MKISSIFIAATLVLVAATLELVTRKVSTIRMFQPCPVKVAGILFRTKSCGPSNQYFKLYETLADLYRIRQSLA